MPLGLCNAPGTFQSLMNRTVYDFIDNYVVIYFDEILLFSNNKYDHIKHLKTVLSRLQYNQLYVWRDKCPFMQVKTESLGIIIG